MDSETAVVVQAVCATKLPTLTFQDVARFRGLIADIFPGGHADHFLLACSPQQLQHTCGRWGPSE